MIDILGDTIPEFNESFTVTLSNPGAGAKLDANPSAKGTIENDDGTGIRIVDSSLAEGAQDSTAQYDLSR